MGFVVVAASTRIAAQQHQPMTIIRLYTGSDGQTHKKNLEVKFSPTTIYPKAEASEAVKVSEAQFFACRRERFKIGISPPTDSMS